MASSYSSTTIANSQRKEEAIGRVICTFSHILNQLLLLSPPPLHPILLLSVTLTNIYIYIYILLLYNYYFFYYLSDDDEMGEEERQKKKIQKKKQNCFYSTTCLPGGCQGRSVKAEGAS